MRTPFGKALRDLREEKSLKLIDVAAAIGVSSAFISAIETGRKPIPDGFLSKVRRGLNLSKKEEEVLRRARDRTRDVVHVESLPSDDRELVAAFARHLGEGALPADFLERLKGKAKLKSIAGEHPFARKRRGMVVAPKSKEALRGMAEIVRGAFTKAEDIMFPIMDVLDMKLCKVFDDYELIVLDREEMGDFEGVVLAGDPALRLRVDVYEDACRGDGRARFTACHELAHYVLHRRLALPRMRDDSIPIYQDSEWQADVFAASLLMPERHAHRFASLEQAAFECGMSRAAAKYQLKQCGREI